MKCIHCQGEMKKGFTPLHIDRKGVHITIEKVPAWVCEQCGEPFFEEDEVDSIQDMLNSLEKKMKSLTA